MHTERFGSYMDNRILIVEDEEKIARFLELELRHEGYDVDKASNGRDGLDKALTGQYALMVLDVMLPELNGFEVLRRLRKNTVMDKVAGLDGGADDYMTKPFAIEELLARIRLALKKSKNTGAIQKGSQLTCKGLNMDVQRYEVTYGEDRIELTHREFELLRVLLESKNLVISRETLLEKVCGYDYLGETNIIDVYVRYLRSKLDDVYQVKWIQTVRGVGYVIRDDE